MPWEFGFNSDPTVVNGKKMSPTDYCITLGIIEKTLTRWTINIDKILSQKLHFHRGAHFTAIPRGSK